MAVDTIISVLHIFYIDGRMLSTHLQGPPDASGGSQQGLSQGAEKKSAGKSVNWDRKLLQMVIEPLNK